MLKKNTLMRIVRRTLIAGAIGSVVACGGGAGVNTAASGEAASLSISGNVVDGPIEGATVFLDLNGNLQRDPGEPTSSPTNALGQFTINVASVQTSQWALATVVTDIPTTAKDADDGGKTLAEAGKSSFTLLAPASAFIDSNKGVTSPVTNVFVSPLTTLVANEVLFNNLTLLQAREQVQRQYALTADPMHNFLVNRDTNTADKARKIAQALGTAKQSVNTAQSADNVGTVEQLKMVAMTVDQVLPIALATGNEYNPESVKNNIASKGAEIAQQRGQANASQEFQDFVVVFKDNVSNPASEASGLMAGRGGSVKFTYANAVKGFAVRLPSAAADAFLEAMSNNPKVDYVEVDMAVQKQGTLTTQTGATWGLDRADQRNLPINSSYTYEVTGAGIRAYVVDTGILATHTDFSGRVLTGYSAISDVYGTHVAGTIGGNTWGVAKGVSLVPVRVLDCAGSGSLSSVIAGLDWVIANNGGSPAVVNLSLGGGTSTSLDSAVAKTVSSGIPVIVAAGNSNVDACTSSPAREPSAITVGATTNTDARASYSNYGSCLDLFAPGSSITSTWFTSSTATNTISGTSMATPHVTGVAALALAANTSATPAQLASLIKVQATPNKVTNAGYGSGNILLYALLSSETTPPTVVPAVSVAVAGLTGNTTASRNSWKATVIVTVKDIAGNLQAGATASGTFTAGGTSVGCTTGTNGSCSINSGSISKKVSGTTFTIKGINGSNMAYDATRTTPSSLTLSSP
jgi:subtilisin family serine protease